MIQEVVASIIEAEDKAKQMIANAEAEASTITASSTKSVQIIDKEAADVRKQYIASSTTSANSQAQLEAQKLIAEGTQEVDGELEKYSVNSYKAVAFVMEQIL